MAQEFYQLFGKNEYGTVGNDTLLIPMDLIGVTMSAIKEAKLEINELKEENEILRSHLLALKKEVRKLSAIVRKDL